MLTLHKELRIQRKKLERITADLEKKAERTAAAHKQLRGMKELITTMREAKKKQETEYDEFIAGLEADEAKEIALQFGLPPPPPPPPPATSRGGSNGGDTEMQG